MDSGVCREIRDSLVQLGRKALLGSPATLDRLEARVRPVVLDSLDSQDRWDSLDLQELRVNRALLDSRVTPVALGQ